MADPFFSVITPSFNQGAWIEGCIQSVLAQGVEDFEHLIIDNVSTDETLAVLARYPHLRWKSEPDSGQAQAVNRGLALARGRVICWLNADDQYLPGAFEIVRRELSQPGVQVMFGDAQEVFFDGRPARSRRARFHDRRDLLIWWEKRTDLLQPSVFFHREVAHACGGLREDLHLILDTEFWWRVSAHHAFHYVPALLSLQQRQPDSKTIKTLPRIYEEKAQVFQPLLDAAEPRRRWQHRWARCRGMGRRWLDLAESALPADPASARQNLRRAVTENPLLAASPRWWRTRWRLHRRGAGG